MKKYNILLAAMVLILASLACQTIQGGGIEVSPPDIPDVNGGGGSGPTVPAVPLITPEGIDIPPIGGKTDFPVPADATNVINVGNEVVNFQTSLSMNDAMKFYRDEFGKSGYTERDGLTVTSDTTFSMVFDGHKSGKAITVQGVDFGNGTLNISITLANF